jgi:hypothetical protein
MRSVDFAGKVHDATVAPSQEQVLNATIRKLREDLDATTTKLFLIFKALEHQGIVSMGGLDIIAAGLETTGMAKRPRKKRAK